MKPGFGRSMLQLGAVLAIATTAWAKTNVITYHNDTLRTGWNRTETILTPASVGGSSFGLLQTVTLDNQVDAEPLVATAVAIAGGTHDVVYVVTESNSVYAIDAGSGAVLGQRSLGVPVPMSVLPGQCGNNASRVGITSTPVIDLGSHTLYAIAYVHDPAAGTVSYVLHGMDLGTLADHVPPVVVTGSHALTTGRYGFNAAASRQRPALLEANGNIYAGFGSFCDLAADVSRGWVLGWNARTLAPLPGNEITDRLTSAPNGQFLTSIWMSGYGLASGGAGNIFFATGNSDVSGTTYDPVNNLSESVVEVSPDLTRVVSYFSPTDPGADVGTLDQHDTDFGSGGVMLLPAQTGPIPLLAAAAGKAGNLYLLNRAALGGRNSSHALADVPIDQCWCGPSYFTGADGIGRVVSSGGTAGIIWKLQTAPAVGLRQEALFGPIENAQDPGFMTSISSNGTSPDSAVIWAISRADGTPRSLLHLHAYDAATGAALYAGTAGTWPAIGTNASLVAAVANGHVYVAAYKALQIFGLAPAGASVVHDAALLPVPAADTVPPVWPHRLSGLVRARAGNTLVIETRDGRRVPVEIGPAAASRRLAPAAIGTPVQVLGVTDAAGTLQAHAVQRAKSSPLGWEPDR